MEAVGIGDASGYNKADYKIQKFEELLKIAGIEQQQEGLRFYRHNFYKSVVLLLL